MVYVIYLGVTSGGAQVQSGQYTVLLLDLWFDSADQVYDQDLGLNPAKGADRFGQ